MLSLPHLIIVFVVALVVFGPEKLPELARNVGKFMAEFRRMTGEFRSTFEGHMRDLEREADERRASGAQASTPVPVPSSTPPAENSIRADAPAPEAASAPAAASGPAVPTPTPAQGIVPSADPRIPVQEASPDAAHDSGANGASSGSSAEEQGESPEPVTDGQHHSN
jgi:sec-independent protein translocase protein TatB